MEKIIRHQFFFPHAPEAVWGYLTKTELMEQWLMKNDFRPEIGLDFTFRTKPIPSLDFDGIFYCRVLEVQPVTRLSYTWNSGPGEGRINLESVVVWRLEPKDNGTELVLEHSGFSAGENLTMFNALNNGWLENLHKIAARLNEVKEGTAHA